MSPRYRWFGVAFLLATTAAAKPRLPTTPRLPPPRPGPIEHIDARGPLEQRLIRAELQERRAKIEVCRPGHDRWRFSLSFSVLANGDVVGKQFGGIAERDVRECVAAAFSDLRFPARVASTTVESRWRIGSTSRTAEKSGSPGCRWGVCVRLRSVTGGLARRSVVAELDDESEALGQCFRLLRKDGVKATWTIRPSGRAASVAVVGGRARARTCVKQRLEAIRFEGASKGTKVRAELRGDPKYGTGLAALLGTEGSGGYLYGTGGGVTTGVIGRHSGLAGGLSGRGARRRRVVRHVQVRGGLTVAEVTRELMKHTPSMRTCYQQAHPGATRPRELATVSLAIGSRGQIESGVKVNGFGRRLRRCIEVQLLRARFRPGQAAKVVFAIELQP